MSGCLFVGSLRLLKNKIGLQTPFTRSWMLLQKLLIRAGWITDLSYVVVLLFKHLMYWEVKTSRRGWPTTIFHFIFIKLVIKGQSVARLIFEKSLHLYSGLIVLMFTAWQACFMMGILNKGDRDMQLQHCLRKFYFLSNPVVHAHENLYKSALPGIFENVFLQANNAWSYNF